MREFTISPTGGQWNSGYIIGGPFDPAHGQISIPTMGLYGPRTPISTPNGVTGNFHYGVDFDGPDRCSLYSLIDGVRVDLGWDTANIGYYVAVKGNVPDDHGNEWLVIYGHLAAEPLVPVGAAVKAGDELGYQDTTGLATGTHLHLALSVAGFNVDPMTTLLSFSGQHPIETIPTVTEADYWHALSVNAESIRVLINAGAPQSAVDARVALAKQQWVALGLSGV